MGMFLNIAAGEAAFALGESSFVGDPKKRPTTEYLVVHKHGVDVPDWPKLKSIVDLAVCHTLHPELKGVTGRLPYHFAVWKDGYIEQGLPLLIRGAHAKDYNYSSIAVAVMYENNEAATAEQLDAVRELCEEVRKLYPEIEIVGHTELDDATSDPTKQCPHPVINMDDLRAALS